MSNRGKFLKESVKNFRRVGSLRRSSPALIDLLLKDIDFSESRLFAEFGAGSGCVTRELLRRMRPDARLFSFELSPVFYDEIRAIDDARLVAVLGGAETAGDFLKSHAADCVVSGLPLGNFSRREKAGILDTVFDVLRPGGRFVQFQYSLLDYRLMRRRFETVTLRFTAMNFPPAFVYGCLR